MANAGYAPQAELDLLAAALDGGKLDHLSDQADAFLAMDAGEISAGMATLEMDRRAALIHGMECAAIYHEMQAARFRETVARLEAGGAASSLT